MHSNELTHRLAPSATLFLAAVVYMVLLGGTSVGEVDPALRSLNFALTAATLGYVVARGPQIADSFDRAIVFAVTLFCIAAIPSQVPRQSVDAAMGAAAWGGALLIGRNAASDPRVRRALAVSLAALCVALSCVAVVAWLPTVLTWWSEVGGFPPLDLPLSSVVWGHKYDLMLAVVATYPSMWLGNPGRLRRAVAALVGLSIALLLLISGSRTLWMAIAVASAVVALRPSLRMERRAWLLVATAVGAVGVTVAGLLGWLGPLISRIATGETVGARVGMWGPLMELWLEHPISGAGTGAFAWILQQTSYFDTFSWAPRHPDNALIQVLAESGLLGFSALSITVATVVILVRRSGSRAAQWVAIVIGISALGGNPTDFGFILAIGLAWLAWAAPNRGHTTPAPRIIGRRWPTTVSQVLVSLLVVVTLPTLIAGFVFERARSSAERGEVREALSDFQVAAMLDPGMGIYHRQKGTALYLVGEYASARDALRTAVARNPADDVAWRTYALTLRSAGDPLAASAAAERAVAVQRSDVANLLLAAKLARERGLASDAQALLSEVVQVHPWIVSAPMWSDAAGNGNRRIVQRATDRWLIGDRAPGRVTQQGIWLSVLFGDEALLNAAIRTAPMETTTARAVAQSLRCDPGTAVTLEGASAAARRTLWYWEARARYSASTDRFDDRAARALDLIRGYAVSSAAHAYLNPINEESRQSADQWGYRRTTVVWPVATVNLPSPSAGAALWLRDPVMATAAIAGLGFQTDCH